MNREGPGKMEFDTLRKVTAAILGMDPDEIEMNMTFLTDLGADSLDVVDLISVIEDEFDLEIPEEAVDSIKTVGDIVNYVEKNASA